MGIDYFDPGGPEPPKWGGGQKSKFSDFTQNDFSERFRRFPEFFFFLGKNFALYHY